MVFRRSSVLDDLVVELFGLVRGRIAVGVVRIEAGHLDLVARQRAADAIVLGVEVIVLAIANEIDAEVAGRIVCACERQIIQ